MEENSKDNPKNYKNNTNRDRIQKIILTENKEKIIDIDNFFEIFSKDINETENLKEIKLKKNKFFGFTDDESFEKRLNLEDEINELRRKLRNALIDIDKVTTDKETKIQELKDLKKELTEKEKINHILPRICQDAREKLFGDDKFKALFEDAKSCEAVVVSIDIRRSTELMLKARKPELFSKFITELSRKLSEVILNNFGIFDKFTGDGILAFFPKFYSGDSAIIRALIAAEECHKIFNEHYNESRECFNVFIKDVGLGIGIDYGNVTLVNSRNDLTVVGIPVVYACRMSGAKAGETLLNQPAKEEVLNVTTDNIKIIESEIEIKHEGSALAYRIEFIKGISDLKAPDWLNIKESKE
ncbi:adenylate/guanylate cyclase domain-containing protein [Flavobacterium sp. I3-2]|uniref:adenylate/guanylate cyclase domain-containing protein n=1 Tax=Flavobacterium sp. I3-2 TaxID=2748319 RepID=UPI0015ABDCC3|nr:adenylate/guanylate cyclase domain-containing protein [Flavobacterium sp. I3-2]